jgi:hypothetical protein
MVPKRFQRGSVLVVRCFCEVLGWCCGGSVVVLCGFGVVHGSVMVSCGSRVALGFCGVSGVVLG